MTSIPSKVSGDSARKPLKIFVPKAVRPQVQIPNGSLRAGQSKIADPPVEFEPGKPADVGKEKAGVAFGARAGSGHWGINW